MDVIQEHNNICAWSARNKLTINIDKTNEIVFHHPASRISRFPKISHPGHCLHYLLPPKTSAHCPYSLRKRQHYYQLLPNIESRSIKTVFNPRLFKYTWLYFVYFVLFSNVLCVFIARQHTNARYWYSKLSVCPSVHYVPVLYENGLTYRHTFFTVG